MTDDRSTDQRPKDTIVPRIDPAHPAGVDRSAEPVAPNCDAIAAVAGKSASHASDQLQQQAAELGKHLRTRQRDLARWEATLNARSAQAEDGQRSARLWLREQQLKLEQRATELKQQAEQLENRASELEASHSTQQALTLNQQQCEQREQVVNQKETRLRQELEAVNQQAAWLDAARSSWQQQRREEQESLQALERQLQAKCRATQELNAQLSLQLHDQQQIASERERLSDQWRTLESVDAALSQQAVALDQEREDFEREKEQLHERTHLQRQSLAERWRQRKHSLQTRLTAVMQHAEYVDQRHDMLHHLKTELRQRQRDIMKTCLTVERLWTALEGNFPPAEFAEIVAKTRTQLRDQLRAEDQARDERQKELQQMADKMSQQQRELRRRRDKLQQWAACRQRELDEQMNGLLAHEREVEQQERRLAEAKRTWRQQCWQQREQRCRD